jgi:hypothetical protein
VYSLKKSTWGVGLASVVALLLGFFAGAVPLMVFFLGAGFFFI